MNNDKKLISREYLYKLIEEWIQRLISSNFGMYWYYYPYTNGFGWRLYTSECRCLYGEALLCDDHWEIYNTLYRKENINIKIYNDHIEFIEKSIFDDFSKEKMYDLYTFLKETIVGIKDKNEEENVMDINVNNVKKVNKLFISQPMTGCDDNEIREYRKRVHRIVSIMFDDPNIELIEQFDVDESNVDFSGMNEAQIRMYRLNRSLSMLMDANIVVFAPNWWKSIGCIEEWIQCQLYTSPHIILGSAIEAVDNTLYNAPITDDYDYNEESRIIETIDTVFKNTKRPSDSIIVENPEIKLNIPAVMFKKTGLPDPKVDIVVKPSPDILMSDNNEKPQTFEEFIKDYISPKKDINDFMYSIMMHDKLIEIMSNAMKDKYGIGNTKITTLYEEGGLNYSATVIFEPNNKNIVYALSTKIEQILPTNSEYHGASYSIGYNRKGKAYIPFAVRYVSSQISPESDDYVSNKCVVDYVGANKIANTERKLFGYINSELKSFINTRDDIVWKKKK